VTAPSAKQWPAPCAGAGRSGRDGRGRTDRPQPPPKPVGTVWFGWNIDGAIHSDMRRFDGDRAAVRSATVTHALARLLDMLQTQCDPGAP
jgi:nicotinamide mononucleotide (NMN) deamidase PncC